MGKYDHVVGNLPKASTLEEDPGRQEKIDAFKRDIAADPKNLKAAALAQEYAAIKDEKEVAERQLYDVNVRLEAIKQLMTEVFETEGLSSVRTHNGHLVSIWAEPIAQVVDKELFRTWCDADPDLRRKMQLWPSTVTAIVKERTLAGEEMPPGVTAVAVTRVRVV